jgi:predicted transcriptional regulator YdeE
MTIELDRVAISARDEETYRFEKRNECWVIGVGGRGPAETREEWMAPLWDAFVRRQGELPPSVDHSVYISPCHSGEDGAAYVGFASPWEVEDLPDGMVCVHLPEGWYAVGEVLGDRDQAGRTHEALRNSARDAGRTLAEDRPCLEIYSDRPDYPTRPLEYEVWLPVH